MVLIQENMGSIQVGLKFCFLSHSGHGSSYAVQFPVTTKPVVITHVGKSFHEFVRDNIPETVYCFINILNKILEGLVVVIVPIFSKKIIKVHVGDNRGIPAIFRFEDFLSFFYYWVVVCKFIYGPVEFDSNDYFFLVGFFN